MNHLAAHAQKEVRAQMNMRELLAPWLWPELLTVLSEQGLAARNEVHRNGENINYGKKWKAPHSIDAF